ncbi:MAG TPA: uracil-DNA glycosylase [Blastocatellia bacterium]|nr:uracil-DNA glycosylase [Blastocatellia bacterium]
MSKEIINETLAISRDIENQLKFFSEMGLEDIGGSASDANEAPSAHPTVSDTRSTGAVPVPNALSAEQQTPSEEPARCEPSDIQQTGLFGEVVAAGQQRTPRRGASLPILESRDPSLEAIRENIGDCRLCRLSEHRKTIVFGEGNPQARLVFVGEGPGAEEDATGRPFVGRAGQLLDKIIVAIGMKREDVYIANIVKCRPPGNRTPERDEVSTCEPFLWRQLALIRPEVIVALGSPAFQCLLRTREPITRVRGEWREWNGIKVMPTFHPAFLLRSPDKKREVWEDMKKVRDYLNPQSG